MQLYLVVQVLSWRISVEHQCNWHIFWPVRCSRKSKLVFFDPLFCLTWRCIRTKLPRRTTLIPRNRTRVSCIPPVCKSDMLSHTFPVSHKSCEDGYCAWGDLETMLPPTKGQPVPESNIISTRISDWSVWNLGPLIVGDPWLRAIRKWCLVSPLNAAIFVSGVMRYTCMQINYQCENPELNVCNSNFVERML